MMMVKIRLFSILINILWCRMCQMFDFVRLWVVIVCIVIVNDWVFVLLFIDVIIGISIVKVMMFVIIFLKIVIIKDVRIEVIRFIVSYGICWWVVLMMLFVRLFLLILVRCMMFFLCFLFSRIIVLLMVIILIKCLLLLIIGVEIR